MTSYCGNSCKQCKPHKMSQICKSHKSCKHSKHDRCKLCKPTRAYDVHCRDHTGHLYSKWLYGSTYRILQYKHSEIIIVRYDTIERSSPIEEACIQPEDSKFRITWLLVGWSRMGIGSPVALPLHSGGKKLTSPPRDWSILDWSSFSSFFFSSLFISAW